MTRKTIALAWACVFNALLPAVFFAQAADLPRNASPSPSPVSPAPSKTPPRASEALVSAVLRNDAKTIEYLCGRGDDPHSLYCYRGCWSILLEAVSQGRAEAATALLRAGADPNVIGKNENEGFYQDTFPLKMAVEKGRPELVKLLLDYKADIYQVDNGGVFTVAFFKGDDAIIRLLLEKVTGADVGKGRGDALLGAAAAFGRVEAVRALLEKGVPVDARQPDGRTPLMAAVAQGQVETARLLIGKGAALEAKDKDGKTPLLIAVEKGRPETARLLLEKGANLEARDARGRTPLIAAAGAGLLDTARLLLEKGADRKTADDWGWTAFGYALGHAQTRVVAYFLDAGEDPNGRLRNGSTPIELAVRQGGFELVGLLAARGAVFQPSANGEFLRETVSQFYRPQGLELTIWLIERGEPVNGTNEDGETVLVIAARSGQEKTVDLLLRHGASAAGKTGVRALEGALQAGNPAAGEMLIRAGVRLASTAMDPPPAKHLTPALVDFIVMHKIAIAQSATADVIFGNALIAAAEKNDAAYAARLLALGAHGHTRSVVSADEAATATGDNTALHAAAKAGGLETVKLLVAHGALVNFAIEIPNDKTISTFIAPLDAALAAPDGTAAQPRPAVDARHMDVARFLVARGAHPGPAFRYAIEVDDRAFFKFLLDSKGDVNDSIDTGRGASGGNGIPDRFTPLMFAAETGRLAMAQALVARGAKLSFVYTPFCDGCDEEETVTFDALLLAIDHGYLEIAGYLFAQGTPLRSAHVESLIRRSYPDALKTPAQARRERDLLTRLLQRVKTIRPRALVMLCDLGDVALIRLMAGKVDVNAADEKGVTPLIAATRSLHPEAVKWLLARGARAAALDREGKTAADYLALVPADQAEIVKAIRKLLQQK